MHRIRSFAKSQASDRNLSLDDTSAPPNGTTLPALARQSSKPSVTKRNSKQSLRNVSQPNPDKSVGKEKSVVASPTASTHNTKEHREETATVVSVQKPIWSTRMKAGSKRFVRHTRNAITHSWINVLLIFVPIGIAVNWIPMPPKTKPTIIFALNAVAIIPLAGLLSHATESVASRMGDTMASLLNVTFGNAVELIIFIIALAKNEIRIVQASILGSILANLLLILGMAFLFGGLRYQEQIYNSTVTQMSACLLSLSVMSLLLPTAFHASFSDNTLADTTTTKISRGTSVVLLLVYVLYLLFQLKSHAYMYESTPQQVIDEESHPGVLAEMLNSSTSESSSSSSGNDTDSSSGSYTTAKKRIKRAFRNRMRRKSNASSIQTASVPSALSSPSTDKPSVFDESPTPPQDGYFELSERQRHKATMGGRSGTQARPGMLLSGDEADTDGENDRGAPRIRDFETEQAGSSKSPPKYTDGKSKKKGKRKNRKGRRDDEKRIESSAVDAVGPTRSSPPEEHIGFAEVTEDPLAPSTMSPKRPFAKRQLSRVRPPLPHVFTNTVFSVPQAPHHAVFQAGPLSAARAITTGIRRTNSLPDRLNRPTSQVQRTQKAPELVRTPDTMVMNEADAIRKDQEGDGHPQYMSRTAAVMLLLVSTGLVAFCAELLVEAIPDMIADTTVSQAFIGLIVLPIVGNAAEHVTAVTVATKNKMDLAIGVAVGSSIQIALFVTPFVVLLGWILGKEMSLYFNLFETVSLFVTAFVVNFLVLDGRSNYLEGSLLIAAYVIIAVAAFFYPATAQQSDIGGGSSNSS